MDQASPLIDVVIDQIDGSSDTPSPSKKRKSSLKSQESPNEPRAKRVRFDTNLDVRTTEIKVHDFVYVRAPSGFVPFIGFVEELDMEQETVDIRWFYRCNETHNPNEPWFQKFEVFAST